MWKKLNEIKGKWKDTLIKAFKSVCVAKGKYQISEWLILSVTICLKMLVGTESQELSLDLNRSELKLAFYDRLESELLASSKIMTWMRFLVVGRELAKQLSNN